MPSVTTYQHTSALYSVKSECTEETQRIMTCFAGHIAADPSAQAATALSVLGSSFGTKGSLAFLTNLATHSASQSLAGDASDSLVTLQQVGALSVTRPCVLAQPSTKVCKILHLSEQVLRQSDSEKILCMEDSLCIFTTNACIMRKCQQTGAANASKFYAWPGSR